MFNDSAKALFLSQGEEEAWDLVNKARFILNHLPPFLRLKAKHETKGIIDFFSNNSIIQALPSTDKAGRGTDATLVVRDELAKHPYGRENFVAIGPAIDGGGQLIDLSTINKLDANNHFTDRVIRARDGNSRAHLVFLGWNLRPVRIEGLSLEEWFQINIKEKYSAMEIEQEYPATLEEALSPAATIGVFDKDAVEGMMLDISSSLKTQEVDTFNGRVRVYKLPQVGHKYCVFTDPSDGIEDPFVTIVMDWRTGEAVATATAKIPSEDCARVHDSLVRTYNNAYNSFEVNASAGGSFGQVIRELGTPNIAPRRNHDGKVMLGKDGWYTTPQMRDTMIRDLQQAIRKRLIICHDREAINEFRTFIQPPGMKPQPTEGAHDDWVMCWAGVWTISRYIPMGDYRVVSSKYKN